LRRRKRLGLALGGGGARGLAHLGVLIALEEEGIGIEALAGTSMGAVIGAAKAIGADLERLRVLLSLIDINQLLQVTDSTIRELQRILGRSMMEYVRGSTWKEEGARPHDLARLNELFSLLTANKSFADTVIPFAAVAADVRTGERIVLREGRLADALTASAAVPGIFSPVISDGRYLVDGGIVDKIPVDAVIEMGAEAVIAVDTGAPLDRRISTCLDALLQAQRVTSHHLSRLQLERAHARLDGRLLVLRPDVETIKMFDFNRGEEAVRAGIEAVHASLERIRAFCKASSR